MELIKLILRLLSGSPFKAGDAQGNLPSPRVNIEYGDIKYNKDRRTLTFFNIEPDIIIQTVQNTNSMEPFPDVGHIVIRSNNPKYLDDLNVGDIIVWKIDRGKIMHTIIEIGNDGEWYCMTAGENLNRPDPEIIRKRHIKDVMILLVPSKRKGAYVAEVGD